MHNTLNDLRFALRQLRRSPAFALTAILTLALGIGANTAIFSLLDQALLRSLPVLDPQQLVILEGTGDAWEGHTGQHGGDTAAYFSYPMYKDLRDHNQAFAGLIATAPADVGISRNGISQLGRAEVVSGNYFTVLGVRPAFGRLLTQNDDTQKDANPVVVLSFEFWKNHLGADPAVVGETLAINGHPFQVLGVAAPDFRSAIWGETPSLFVPMSMLGQIVPGKDKRLIDHTDRWMNILGRLKPGESRDQAAVAIAPLWHALRAEELKALGIESKHFKDEFPYQEPPSRSARCARIFYDRNTYERPLLAIMFMAVLVLLIATVNVASLLLVRSAARVREFSLRYALGANATRILRQLLLEGLLIGIAGGVTGIAACSRRNPRADTPARWRPGLWFLCCLDRQPVAAFHFAIAVGVSILFSLAPVLQLRRPDLTLSMRQQSSTGSGAMLSFRRAVVCLQIGLSVLLLVGAGLFVRTCRT